MLSIHAQMIKTGLHNTNYALSKLLEFCVLSPHFDGFPYAISVFATIQEPNQLIWNTMLRGYALSSDPVSALKLYVVMISLGLLPNSYTFPFLLKSCAKSKAFEEGQQIHGHVLKLGYEPDLYVHTSLISMYAQNGRLEDAHKVFDRSSHRDVVSYTALITGYASSGNIRSAQEMFDEIPVKDVVSWNAMISGYAETGSYKEALELFKEMMKTNVRPDEGTMVTVLSACAQSRSVELGRQIALIACVLFLIVISITFVSSSPGNGEVEDETEFNYEKGGGKGPERWGTIKPEWAMCGKGTMQSPIDLTDKRVLIDHSLGSLRSRYLPSNATIKNRGHDIMLKFGGGNQGAGISINGTDYQLQQIHWHTPSEHTINGIRFVLEEHMVHESKDGRIAVVAFFYILGRPDSFLFTLERHLKKITDAYQAEEPVGMIDPRRVVFESKHYYRYLGSLTTPPCSENVIWSIAKEMRTVTRKQLKLLRVAVHDQSDTNARPLQRKNERPVKLYLPTWHI
ncbi:unnamed protein product [Thlaspi arvense]|uniref:Alpha-carbonic anhydrase domain-containing protein n=1 Tax=Thlaspi arvense TaxID=13288 RepID=A0AAU9RDA4_THLAR|nr:unnamed protein product [Thlaspi arvense]